MAHWLKDRGFEAYALIGGVTALDNGHRLPVEVDTPPVASGESTPRRGALAALHHPRFRIYSAGVLLYGQRPGLREFVAAVTRR